MSITSKMQDAFNAQIIAEMYSSNLYLQMSCWFRKEGWKGFSSWMYKQAEEERSHAMDMAQFILHRGGEVVLTAIIAKYIDEQVEEERNVQDILDSFAHLSSHAIAHIDSKLSDRK